MLNCIKMNEIVNNFLLAGDTFMPEMHLKQLRFTYNACGPFTKTRKVGGRFTKMNLIKLVFNMIWHMEILKI